MPGHTDWRSYWADVEPRLEAFTAAQLSSGLRSAFGEALGFFGYVTEDLQAKATQHQDEQRKFAPLLIEALDLLRGIKAGYEAQALASLTVSLRTVLEIRFGVEFVSKSGEIPRYADLFVRFKHAERMKHSRGLLSMSAAEMNNLSEERRSAIRAQAAKDEEEARKLAPEWFDEKGKLHADHWTGLGRSIFDVARDAGLESDYRVLYSSTSKFTHGSPLVGGMYSTPDGIGPLALHVHCMRMATLGSLHCLSTLRVWCEMFGISFPAEYYAVRKRIEDAANRVQAPNANGNEAG